MRIGGVVVYIFAFLSACTPYPGYKAITPEIYYSLIEFGESRQKAIPGDYVTINIEYRNNRDSVFFSGKRKVKINNPVDDSSVDHCFLHMNEGDSASFIIPAEEFFTKTLKRNLPSFIKEDEVMKLNVRLLEAQSESEFQREKQLFLAWSAELSDYENAILKQYLKGEVIGIEQKPEGLFILTVKKGNGIRINKGDHIWVHYEGKFLNGKFFDGTYRSNQPIDFVYGTGFILISGLDQALSYMSEGEKALVILPSELAFGEKGDEFGIIPPYTSLIYTLEVLKIEKY